MIRMTAVPNSRCRSRISSSTCAWTVTSSAVVGSSAMSSVGLQRHRHRDHRRAAACRRRTGAGSRRPAVAAAGCRPGRAARRRGRAPAPSMTCVVRPDQSRRSASRPGSTGAGWTAGPGRSCRSARRGCAAVCSGPASEQVLAVEHGRAADVRAPRVSPMIVCVDTLLPEPDSPTMPSVVPGVHRERQPRTACTTPSGVVNDDLQVVNLDGQQRRAVLSITVGRRQAPGSDARAWRNHRWPPGRARRWPGRSSAARGGRPRCAPSFAW